MNKFDKTKFNINDSLIKNKNILKAYGLMKLYKIGQPAGIIVPCIDSPIEELSNYYKNILTAAFPRPQHVIKNSSDFKQKIQNIKVPKNHVMASLDVETMFPSITIGLVFQSIKKRGKYIKQHTKLPLNEFLKALEILMMPSINKLMD